jgi:hypothetical protein
MATDNVQENANDSRSEIVQQDEVKPEYVLEYFRSAREELILHFNHRENWIQLQMLSQVILLALALGVGIAGIETSVPYPHVLALSTAISFVFTSLYYADDSLISHIGNYIRSLPVVDSKLPSWDASTQAEHYVRSALPIRYLAQLTAFAIIPSGLCVWRISSFAGWGTLQIIEVVIHIVFLSLIVYLILRGFLLRLGSYSSTRFLFLKSIEPADPQS